MGSDRTLSRYIDNTTNGRPQLQRSEGTEMIT